MTAKVIKFRPRRGPAADPATLVRAARGSRSRAAFAEVLSTLLGWPAKPGMIRAWETGVTVPVDVIVACQTGAEIPGELARQALVHRQPASEAS